MSDRADPLRVTVAYSPDARQLWQVTLELPAGATLGDALIASGLYAAHPQAQGLPVGIWGRKESLDTALRTRDRIEVYRPLRCDPKEARRIRYRQRKERLQQAAAAAAAQAPVSGNPSS